MKNLFKKNQLMITALAIMIAIAGYLQFSGSDLGDHFQAEQEALSQETGAINTTGSTLEGVTVDGNLDLKSDELTWAETEIDSLDSDKESLFVEDYLDTDLNLSDAMNAAGGEEIAPEEGEIPGEAVFTSATDTLAVLSEAKLLKEQTRAKNKEMLLDIINSEGLSEAQKQTAVDSMVRMTNIAEKETAAEILLEAKGFTDVVVSINGTGADVVVNELVLDDVKRARIEDVVSRKTEISPENIIISTVANN